MLCKVATYFLWEIERKTCTFLFIWQTELMKCLKKLVLLIDIMQECVNTWTLFGLFFGIKEWCVWTFKPENGKSTNTLWENITVQDAYLYKITYIYSQVEVLKDYWLIMITHPGKQFKQTSDLIMVLNFFHSQMKTTNSTFLEVQQPA